MKFLRGYFLSLVNPQFMPIALKVAVVIGSLLFAINHGAAFVQGQMTRDRWISATLTYLVPYFVNIHGQYISSSRRLK
ncbi:nitrate/nitrite transporter NrtS [Chroogloeocystis siderophila]|jgi:hypothetical protein|nr:nitrate/nitrite transporter NrtS [Chroogloeocystis siderophila]